MGHRWLSLEVVAASFCVLLAADLAHAEKKPHGAASQAPKGAPLPPSARGGKTKQPTATAPAAAAGPKTIKVCVRPEGVDEKIGKWTFGETYKPVVTDVDATAKRVGNRIFIFDEKADFDSPKSFPAPFHTKKCPKDDRKEEAAPKSNGNWLLPSSGSAFPSAQLLGPSGPLLGTGSLGSSGTSNSAKILVEAFLQKAAGYQGGSSADEQQAAQFAGELHGALTEKRALGEIAVGALTPGAATILAGVFGESLAAAMARQPVIGPLDVLQKMVPAGKTAAWGVLPLMGKDVMDGYKLDSPDTVPAVILPLAEYEQLKKALADLIHGPLPPSILLERYKQAYGNKPEWLASIKPYF